MIFRLYYFEVTFLFDKRYLHKFKASTMEEKALNMTLIGKNPVSASSENEEPLRKKPRFAAVALPPDVISLILRFAFSFDPSMKELNTIFAKKSLKKIAQNMSSCLNVRSPKGATLPLLKSLVRRQMESGTVPSGQLERFVESFRRKTPELVAEDWNLEEGQDIVLMHGLSEYLKFWDGNMRDGYVQSGYMNIRRGRHDNIPLFGRVLKVTQNKIWIAVHDVEVTDLASYDVGCDEEGIQLLRRLQGIVCEKDLFRSAMTFYAINEGRKKNPNEIVSNWRYYN